MSVHTFAIWVGGVYVDRPLPVIIIRAAKMMFAVRIIFIFDFSRLVMYVQYIRIGRRTQMEVSSRLARKRRVLP